MNGENMVSYFMNQKSPSKPSKNIANVNYKSVGIVDTSNSTNLDSDASIDSLHIDMNNKFNKMADKAKDIDSVNIDINTKTVDMAGKAKYLELEVSE